MPIVKIEFIGHNRKYTIGIRQFLDAANISMTDVEIQTAIAAILRQAE
jgi:hypothetical protein